MSTKQEQIEAIRNALNIAEKRRDRLQMFDWLSPKDSYELDMTLECIRRGEIILKEFEAGGGK